MSYEVKSVLRDWLSDAALMPLQKKRMNRIGCFASFMSK